MTGVLTNTKFIKICTINFSFNHVDTLLRNVVTSQFYHPNIIFTAKIITRFVNDIGTVKIVIEYLNYIENMQ